ncbi:hypothetical protein SAMN05216419_103618 [Nitrosomonas cryotolerans]|uniref:Uncharacterized protein n=1 Tax=Nitrosomonas cryotolerans ATCC 49181 TaxID=1131553 RepID=A0A1N6FQC5_9PROT|nr:DUF6781 family protein [Nitrosomonas cryotolerans]SFP94457.1 hypothetical protein SAMN05216419_103618 [Nitrosomonas cryotolerans]SIN97473.1 hypothetical protein SAMN02743940_0354 [Nitrosomonas cryotolerans ATCC 49181]
MQNKNSNAAGHNIDMATLETEIRHAVAEGTHIQETVQHLTLKAMNADSLDFESLRRIVTAVMQGAHQGVNQQLQQTTNQTQTAKTQITETITGLDSALAKFAEASKLAVEEAASRAQKYSDQELTRTRTDLESLEGLLLETLQDAATATKGLVSDTLHDFINHAKRNGTAVGEQLKETLAIFAQQTASIGHDQLDVGTHLAHTTANLIREIASGILTGIKDQHKSGETKKDA